MLSFLNSVVLPALLAVSIPILIHLFSRQKTKKVLFSSVRFLKLLENRRIRQVRLYQILLIILRSLFILFLILAFARPTLRDSFFGDSTAARTTAVIMLDDSYSMQAYLSDGTAMDKGKELAGRILSTFEPQDQVYLVAATQADDPLDFSRAGTEVRKRLQQWQASNVKPDFTPMINRAAQLLEQNPNYNRELYLISDFKINEKQLQIQPAFKLDSLSTAQYLVPVSENSALRNLSVDTAFIANRLFETNQPVKVQVRLTNHNREQAMESAVHLFAGEKRVAMQRVRIAPGEKTQVYLSYITERPGWQFLKIETDEDDLLRDNAYYLSFRVPERINILYVADTNEAELSTALRIISGHSSLDIKSFGYNRLYGLALAGYDLIILNNPPQLSPQLTARLKSFMAQGKNLFIIPGDRLTPNNFNRQFRVLFGRDVLKDLQQAGQNGYFLLNRNSGRQPLFSAIFRDEKGKPALPRFTRYFKIIRPQKTLLSFENNDAYLVRYQPKNMAGSIFLTTASFGRGWTDFALRGFFIPMLHRVLLVAGHREQQSLQTVVGKSLSVSFDQIQADKQYSLKDPDGEIFPLLPETRSGSLRFFVRNPLKPGHFRILDGERIVGAFSVNIASGELDRPYVNWEKLWPQSHVLQQNDHFSAQILQARKGQELWRLFVVLALFMLGAEMLVIRRLEGKES